MPLATSRYIVGRETRHCFAASRTVSSLGVSFVSVIFTVFRVFG
jgi:hypothetical protein